VICLQCHMVLEPAPSGRPRLYCSASCRQRAYRQRSRTAMHDGGELLALARNLRDNAERLLLLAQGWQPPDESSPASLTQLAADTAILAARLADLDRAPLPAPRTGDETHDENDRPPSPGQGIRTE
jgi:hypothetical protein